MTLTIYALSLNAQHKELTEYCFGTCGKIRSAGLIICDAPFFPCKEVTCPNMEKEVAWDEKINGEDVVIRRLRKLRMKQEV